MTQDEKAAPSAKLDDSTSSDKKEREGKPWVPYRVTNPNATKETRDDIAFALRRKRRMGRLRPDHPEDYERFYEDFGIRLEPGQWAIIN